LEETTHLSSPRRLGRRRQELYASAGKLVVHPATVDHVDHHLPVNTPRRCEWHELHTRLVVRAGARRNEMYAPTTKPKLGVRLPTVNSSCAEHINDRGRSRTTSNGATVTRASGKEELLRSVIRGFRRSDVDKEGHDTTQGTQRRPTR
jgi:hypothetical protein